MCAVSGVLVALRAQELKIYRSEECVEMLKVELVCFVKTKTGQEWYRGGKGDPTDRTCNLVNL